MSSSTLLPTLILSFPSPPPSYVKTAKLFLLYCYNVVMNRKCTSLQSVKLVNFSAYINLKADGISVLQFWNRVNINETFENTDLYYYYVSALLYDQL